MKKRLLSLLVALCMLATLLPVSALTAAAEDSNTGKPLKISRGYPVLDNIPHETVDGHTIYTGDGWTYDADDSCKLLTLYSGVYDFEFNHGIALDQYDIYCSITIMKNATIIDGIFYNSSTIINYGTITGGSFLGNVTNNGTITGGVFYSSVTNESDGIIENGQFGFDGYPCTVQNNGGTINGGIFKDTLSISGSGNVTLGYTLRVETPTGFSSASVNDYDNSCYIIPNRAYSVPVKIVFYDNVAPSLPPLDVTIGDAQHMLLSDWCGSDLKFERISGSIYEVTFTAPPANGVTEVVVSALKALYLDKNGYPTGTEGGTKDYTGDGWSYDSNSNTLTLSPDTATNYDFTSTEINPHGVAVNCNVKVGANATITDGNFSKQTTVTVESGGCIADGEFAQVFVKDGGTVSGGVSASMNADSGANIQNGIFAGDIYGEADSPNGVIPWIPNPTTENRDLKKITVSDGGNITALKLGKNGVDFGTPLDTVYVIGTPTESTLYVTLSSGKVREVKLPLTADLELQLNDPEPPKPEPDPEPEPKPEPDPKPEPEPDPKPEPEPETYTLKVVGGSFTTGGSDAQTSGTVPVNAEAKVTLDPSAVPEGMVFDQWTISEESLLGNPNVAYNAESFTIPANAVAKGTTVTVEAQYREATIESEGPGILGTAAMIGTAGAGAAVLGYTGYMIGTELYLNTVLPAGAAIPNNAGELALLLWTAAGTPAPAAVLPAGASPVQQALAWAIENQLLAADASAEDSVTRWEVIRSWEKVNA